MEVQFRWYSLSIHPESFSQIRTLHMVGSCQPWAIGRMDRKEEAWRSKLESKKGIGNRAYRAPPGAWFPHGDLACQTKHFGNQHQSVPCGPPNRLWFLFHQPLAFSHLAVKSVLSPGLCAIVSTALTSTMHVKLRLSMSCGRVLSRTDSKGPDCCPQNPATPIMASEALRNEYSNSITVRVLYSAYRPFAEWEHGHWAERGGEACGHP